jgi:hypothetical protein
MNLNFEKQKIFRGNIYSSQSNSYFEEQLCVYNMDFYIRYWPGPNVQSIE